MDCSSSVRRILQARILEWVAIPFFRRSSQPRDWSWVSCIADRFFFLPSEPPGRPGMLRFLGSQRVGHNRAIEMNWTEPPRNRRHVVGKWKCKSLSHVQLFATPWTMQSILKARILEWVAFPFSRESSQPRNWTQVSCIAGEFLTSWPQGKPRNTGVGSLSLLQWIFLTQESNRGLELWYLKFLLKFTSLIEILRKTL